jgi:hypothetical protein
MSSFTTDATERWPHDLPDTHPEQGASPPLGSMEEKFLRIIAYIWI